MNDPCPLCQSKLHQARMKFKNGEEGTFIFCQNPDCDYKERRDDNEQAKPGAFQEVSVVLAK